MGEELDMMLRQERLGGLQEGRDLLGRDLVVKIL